MPLRSTGCATCRRRKIRCDEGRPGCKRCATHGVQCPGYRGEKIGSIEFEDQTSITVKRASASQTKPSPGSRRPSNKTSSALTHAVEVNNGESQILSEQMPNGYSPFWPLIGNTPPEMIKLTALPKTLKSPTAERMQLYYKFVEGYIPQDSGKLSLHFDYLRLLVSVQDCHQSLTDGLDALSLVHMASQTKSKSLIPDAIKSYSKSLTGLSRAISDKKAVRDDSILAAATVLSVCEFYDEIKLNGLGWMGHQNGLSQLLAARGPASLKTDLALMLFFNARHGALAHGLIMRKAPVFASPAWRACAFRVPVPDPSTTFYDFAIQIPALLERYDAIDFASPTALERVIELMTDCERLEFGFRNWEIGLNTRFRVGQRKPYWVQDIETFTVLPRIVPSRQITQGYMFHYFLEGYLFVQYWQCMHILRDCIGSLQVKRSRLDPLWLPDPGTEVTIHDLNQYIFHLCHSMPYLTEPQTSISGHVALFLPIRIAAFHFRKYGMWDWLQWVGTVRDTVFTRGVSQPNVGDPGGVEEAQEGLVFSVTSSSSPQSQLSTAENVSQVPFRTQDTTTSPAELVELDRFGG